MKDGSLCRQSYKIKGFYQIMELLFFIFYHFFFLHLLNHPCRIAYRYAARCDVFHYYASGTDGNIISYRYTREDGGAPTYPTVVSNGDRKSPLLSTVPFYRIGGVTSGVDVHIWANEAVITNGHQRLIEHRKIEVSKEPLPHTDMFAIITEKRLVDECIIITLSKNLM